MKIEKPRTESLLEFSNTYSNEKLNFLRFVLVLFKNKSKIMFFF
jgi:hypothetical protein